MPEPLFDAAVPEQEELSLQQQCAGSQRASVSERGTDPSSASTTRPSLARPRAAAGGQRAPPQHSRATSSAADYRCRSLRCRKSVLCTARTTADGSVTRRVRRAATTRAVAVDAEGEEERAVVGGNEDGREGESTDSGVRVGLAVHSGQAAVGPASRSESDSAGSGPPRLSREHSLTCFATTVTEVVCTVDSCTPCCKYHLRHNKTGYGRCMRAARRPLPDCECAGKCPAGCCAQVECASSHVTVDLTRSQSCLQHDDQRPSIVPDVSHSLEFGLAMYVLDYGTGRFTMCPSVVGSRQ